LETGYLYAADETEIAVGKMKKATVEGTEVLIANVTGHFASEASDPFRGDLSEGHWKAKS